VTKLAITWRIVDKYYINFEMLRDQNMRTLCTVLVKESISQVFMWGFFDKRKQKGLKFFLDSGV
jgi:hypothetical protein